MLILHDKMRGTAEFFEPPEFVKARCMKLTASDRSADFRTDEFRFRRGSQRGRLRASAFDGCCRTAIGAHAILSSDKDTIDGVSQFAFRLSKRVLSVEAFALNRR